MSIELPNEKKIVETEEFKSFSEEIDYLITFFKDFSELILFSGRVISFISAKEFYTLNTVLIDSSKKTLESIKICCSIGSFSDANTLVRKLRDDLLQYVYILNVISLRKTFRRDVFKENNVENSKTIELFNKLTKDEQAVCAWFENKVSDLPYDIRMKLTFENYMNVLKQNEKIKSILIDYQLQKYWEKLRNNLNNYVHNNGMLFTYQNSVESTSKNLSVQLKNINTRTTYVSSLFLVLLLMVDSTLVMSSDYIDYLDCDKEPPYGSQYLIANFIQEFIDNKVSKLHPELKEYLVQNNISGMKIE